MTDEQQPPVEPVSPEPAAWAQPTSARRRRSLGFLPWLIAGIAVLLLAAGAGLGAAYLVAQMQAAPPPETALPDPTPTLAPLRTPAPTASPTPGATATPTEEPEPTDDPDETAGAEATPRQHVVGRGESISIIAAEYGVTIEEIIELNDLQNPDVIYPGQVLLIP